MSNKENLKELLKVLEENPENVTMANEAPTIATDGECSMLAEVLYFGSDSSETIVSIGLQDGGGFTSIYINKAQWMNIQKSIDLLFSGEES